MISIQLRVFFLHQDRAGQAELVEYLEWFGPVREALRVLKFATDLHEKGALDLAAIDIFFASINGKFRRSWRNCCICEVSQLKFMAQRN